jgi:phospholipid/cholesterol/gamma-HCH transport system substrate-binding protein
VETKEIGQQVKLGAFVLGGLVLFIATVLEGLKEGDNVWLSGVKIGTVTDVKIASQGRVLVKLNLKDKQSDFIRKDATASIGSDGLVGNKIVVIRPGTAPESIEPNDTINATSPTDTQDLINIAKDVGENTRSLTADLSKIAKRINEGQGIVGELLNDGQLAIELRQAVSNLSSTGNNTAMASAELHKLVYELRNGTGLMPTLIRDTSYAATFKSALGNIEKVSANAEVVSNNLQTLAAKLNDDNNAIGVLLSDKTMANQLRQTVENTERATEKLDANMEALQHNFLLRGYFRKQDRKKAREAKEAAAPASSKRD